jgi:hypothetical protein
MKQIISDDIKQYVSDFSDDCEFGGMSESLAKMVNYFINQQEEETVE